MGFQHNLMAHQVSALLLQQVRAGQAAWSHPRLSAKTTLWQGISDWPRPDIALEDRTTKASLALEFKPPNQPKREYVTGLGQVLTYLNDFEFAGLVVPELAADGFKIAAYFSDMLKTVLGTMPIALFAYGQTPTQLAVLQPLKTRMSPPGRIPAGIGRDVFWGYWRDLSHHDLLTLLNLADVSAGGGFEHVFLRFWKRFATTGRARKWDGDPRKPKGTNAPGFSGERANAFLAMRHSGLLAADGRLTASGHDLLRAGKIYGAASVVFVEKLAQAVLSTGRHLDLILWVEEQQRLIPTSQKRTAARYHQALDGRLAAAGIIAPLPPTAAKQYFLRDEPKLWNKLGLLVLEGKTRYFHPGHGLVFNWRKIISVLEVTTQA